MTDRRPHILVSAPAELTEDAALDAVRAAVEGLGDNYDARPAPADDATNHPDAPHRAQAELLLDAIGEGVLLIDADGSIGWSNAFFRNLDEATRASIAGVSGTAAEYFRDMNARTLAGPAFDPARSCKFEVDSDDGSQVFDVFVSPVHRPVGEAAEGGLAVVVRDVTDARKTQRKMAAIDNAGRELLRLEAANVREMNSYQRLQLLEKRIVESMKQLLSYDHFAIFLIDPKTNKLELIVSAGLPSAIQDLNLFAEEEGSGISGYVAATGRSYICQDTTSDDRFLPGLAGARGSLTVPLRLHDRVIGIMDVESREGDAFDAQDQQFVEILARHIAMALHMLDLLVAERSTVNESVADRVVGELKEPLEDLAQEVAWLSEAAEKGNPEMRGHVARIREDIESIRKRMSDVAEGPQTLLGVDRAMAQRETEPLLEGRRVLVADDHPKIRKIIGEVLGHRGCGVTVCATGQEAIDALERAAEHGERFDLVLSDIQMPDRNGYEVFSAARRVGTDTPVILMTGFGYDPHHSIVRASQEGLQAVLFKPFEIELLLEQVRKALAEQHAAS